ncbi:MAG: tetratricopeptide repeat protein [Candidatus Binataceae bacterium]
MNTIKRLLRLAALGGLAATLSTMGGVAGDLALAATTPGLKAPSAEGAGVANMTSPPLGRAEMSAEAGGPILLAHLSEQNLPPKGGLSVGGASPSASSGATGTTASPEMTPIPGENWKRLPAGATPVSGTAGDQASASEASPEPTPGADNQGPPPALDVGAVNFGPDLADQSLEPEIKSAETPALAASLRFTEEGRKQLAGSRIDQALRSLAHAVSIDPGNPYEYFYMGRAWMAKRNYEQALTFFTRAEIGATPQWQGEAVSFEGACYEELGKLEDALSAYRRALTASPNNLMARVGFSRLGGTMASDASLDSPPPATDAALPPPPGSDIGPPPTEASPPTAPLSPDTDLPPESAPSEASPSD